MKVLQVITDRDRRGAQVFAVDLSHGLIDLGVEVTTVALTAGRHGDLLPLDALGSSRYSVRTFAALRRLARSHDVVIAHGSSTLLACSVALFAKVPFVYRQISDPLHWASSWARRARVGVLLRRARTVVVLSESVKRLFARHYRLSVAHMVVIPNAVPANGFWPASPSERADARIRFGLPADSFVGAYIGALAEEKGVDLAVGTAADASVDTLLIVGDGPDRERLEQLSCGLPPGRVRFTGSLDKTIDVLHAVDVLLLPSRGGDSMPAVLIEAGLCSVPTVTTPVGAIEDVVVDGATGYVVPIGDQASFSSAVRSLAMSADTRSAFGASARERCLQRFTIEATAPLWVTLLERAVRSRSRTGLSSFSQPHRA